MLGRLVVFSARVSPLATKNRLVSAICQSALVMTGQADYIDPVRLVRFLIVIQPCDCMRLQVKRKGPKKSNTFS